MLKTSLVIVGSLCILTAGCKNEDKEKADEAAAAAKKKADEIAAAAKKKAADDAAAAKKKADDAAKAAAAAPATATAEMKPTKDSKVAGTVSFEQKANGPVTVKVELTGLTPGDHGFHIHEKGDCSSPDGKSAGGHFNPGKTKHGAPTGETKHAGDFGNVTADKDGKVSQTLTYDFVTLGAGDNSIIGRGVIVHAKADDLKSQPTGAAGGRIACGVVKAAAATAP